MYSRTLIFFVISNLQTETLQLASKQSLQDQYNALYLFMARK